MQNEAEHWHPTTEQFKVESTYEGVWKQNKNEPRSNSIFSTETFQNQLIIERTENAEPIKELRITFAEESKAFSSAPKPSDFATIFVAQDEIQRIFGREESGFYVRKTPNDVER